MLYIGGNREHEAVYAGQSSELVLVSGSVPSGLLGCVAPVRTDVSEEYRLHYHGGKNRRARNNVSSNYQQKHAMKLDAGRGCCVVRAMGSYGR
jgi:hypothetical protein